MRSAGGDTEEAWTEEVATRGPNSSARLVCKTGSFLLVTRINYTPTGIQRFKGLAMDEWHLFIRTAIEVSACNLLTLCAALEYSETTRSQRAVALRRRKSFYWRQVVAEGEFRVPGLLERVPEEQRSRRDFVYKLPSIVRLRNRVGGRCLFFKSQKERI